MCVSAQIHAPSCVKQKCISGVSPFAASARAYLVFRFAPVERQRRIRERKKPMRYCFALYDVDRQILSIGGGALAVDNRDYAWGRHLRTPICAFNNMRPGAASIA